MEKCPPAEACRDAFERMSRATVSMGMSTSGFGFSRDIEGARPSFSAGISSSGAMPMTLDTEPSSTTRSYIHPSPPKVQNKRPPPRFDMNLRDLFPEDIEANSRPSQTLQRPLPGWQSIRREQPLFAAPLNPASSYNQQSTRYNSTTNANIFDPTNAASLSQSRSQSQSQQQVHDLESNTAPATSPFSDPSININSYNPDFMSGVGLEFLNSTMASGVGPSPSSLAAPSNQNSSATDSMSGVIGTSGGEMGDDLSNFNFDSRTGLDLGFGMGLDLQHDWSDGQQLDLFDGFFFGNNGYS